MKHLPEWIMKRYALLWFKFKDREFTKKDVDKTLKNARELKKLGWEVIKIWGHDLKNENYKTKLNECIK